MLIREKKQLERKIRKGMKINLDSSLFSVSLSAIISNDAKCVSQSRGVSNDKMEILMSLKGKKLIVYFFLTLKSTCYMDVNSARKKEMVVIDATVGKRN